MIKTAVIRCFSSSLLLVLSLQGGCSPKAANGFGVDRTLPIMGTFLRIKAYSNSVEQKKLNDLIDRAFDLGVELETIFNIYDPGSELNMLNITGSMNVSSELLEVFIAAEKINKKTDGAFDPTVVAVLKESGFYDSVPREIFEMMPSDASVSSFKNVKVDHLSGKVELGEGIWIDLSGIAKGYVVDRMSEFLRSNGVKNFLINAGGDIYCSREPEERNWRIGIRFPGTENIIKVLEVKNKAVATSGDYENMVMGSEEEGYLSHIVDPFTLTARRTSLTGFTVIAGDCMTADALATAMLVMGAEKAIKLADSIEGVDVLAVDLSEKGEPVSYSSGVSRYISTR